ncbi:MAG: DUF4340 domain-containing protein [Gammaproteobacteria bacterium]
MTARHLIVLVLTIVVIGVAWKVSQDKAPQTEVERAPLYPALLERINDADRIVLSSAEHTSELERSGERWLLANRDGFEATGGDVRRLLLQVAGLRTVEAKTASPERYARLGVADVGEPGADGTLLEITGGGDTLASLVVGHTRDVPGAEQRYVRRAGEAQSWLVDGALEAPADPIRWVDAAIVDIDTSRISEVQITSPGATDVVIRKAEPDDNFFELMDVPDGFEAKSRSTVSSLGAVLLDLRFNDVAAASRLGDAAPARTTVARTFDGLVAILEDFELDGEVYTRFGFRYEASLDTTADGAEPGDDAGEDAEADAAPDVPAEVEMLNERTAGWIYVLPNYKRRMLDRTFDSLVTEAKDDSDDA